MKDGKKKLNILAVCHYGLYEDLSFSFVHNQLREYAAAGHNVRVLIPIGFGKTDRKGKRFGIKTNRRTADGVELMDVPYLTLSSYGEKKFNGKSAICSIRLRKKLLKDFRPDVIHAHTVGFDSRIGAWLKEKYNCPLVVTTHGGDTEKPLNQGRIEEFRRDCDAADVISAVSSKLADRVRSCGTKTPVRTILNGFVLRERPEEIRRDPMKMIQVGHLIPSKKVDVTIRAFAQLKEKYPEMTLTVIGKGHLRESLEQLCRELNVADSVTFMGEIENRRVFEEMCGAAYFVMVSKPEGFGIVYLEAMAAGCVTIGTEGEGIADLIRNGENGYLLPADNPQAIVQTVCRCMENPEEAKALAEAGRSDACGLTWAQNGERYLELFRELVEKETER